MIQLRPYQTDLLNKIVSSYSEHTSVLGQLPTAAGKTILVAQFISSLLETVPVGNIYFCCNRIELVVQTSNVLADAGIPHSFISSQFSHDATARVFVCTMQTLTRRTHLIDSPLLVVADEAHLFSAPTFQKCLDIAKHRGAKILGITATPKTSAGKGLGSIFGHMITGPSIKELIEQGYLAVPKIYVPPKTAQLVSDHEGEWQIKKGDYNPNDVTRFFTNNQKVIYGDTIENFNQLNPDRKPTAVFCSSVKHVHETVQMFNDAGIPAVGIDGSMSKKYRLGVLEHFRQGQYVVMVSCELLLTGYDFPECYMGIWLRPTKSLTVWLQGNGRLMRVTPDKRECIIIDQVDNTSRLGPSFIDRYWSLDLSNPKKRTDSISGASLKLCLKCGTYQQQSVLVCKNCGSPFKSRLKTFKVLYEQLQCITIESAQQLIEQTVQKIINKEKYKMLKTKEDFVNFAREKGWANPEAWADKALAQKKVDDEIYFHGTRDQLLLLGAKRKKQDPAAFADEVLKKRVQFERRETNPLYANGTLEDIIVDIKQNRPDIQSPEKYAEGILRKRLAPAFEQGTDTQKAEATVLVSGNGDGTPKDQYDELFEYAKSGKAKKSKNINGKWVKDNEPSVFTDEEAHQYAQALVKFKNKAVLESGSADEVKAVAKLMRVKSIDAWTEAVLAKRA